MQSCDSLLQFTSRPSIVNNALFFYFQAGEKAVEYNGRTFTLSDDPAKEAAVFVEGDCVIELNLKMTADDEFRDGNGYVYLSI